MKTPNHILVIRLSAMGDVAMTVPVLRVLSKTYPNLKITVVSKNKFRPIFKDIPYIHFLEADVYGKHKGFRIFSLAKEAKEEKIDAVADLHNVLRSKFLRWILWFSGIKNQKIDKGRTEKKQLTEANGKPLKKLKSTQQRYAEVFSKLGLPIELQNHKVPPPQKLSAAMHEVIGNQPKKLIGIAPFAAHQGKMYPLHLMKEVVAILYAKEQHKIFLFGGGKEEEKILAQWKKDFPNLINVAGRMSFNEELSLISNLDGMIAMDSGNGHLAAMYGVPVITLWGVTHPYMGFVPFGQPNTHQIVANREEFPLIPTSVYGNELPAGYDKAMETIPVSLVVEKTLKIF